jgi:hypothetical protein
MISSSVRKIMLLDAFAPFVMSIRTLTREYVDTADTDEDSTWATKLIDHYIKLEDYKTCSEEELRKRVKALLQDLAERL